MAVGVVFMSRSCKKSKKYIVKYQKINSSLHCFFKLEILTINFFVFLFICKHGYNYTVYRMHLQSKQNCFGLMVCASMYTGFISKFHQIYEVFVFL